MNKRTIFTGMLLSALMVTHSDAETVDLKGLLAQMLDRSQIAEFPEPEFVCSQASSYCRKSEKPGTPEWFATGDCSQFIRCEEVGDRREWVMADIEEPGAIVRWWITQYKYDGTQPPDTALRSGHRLFQRPSRQKQFPSIR